MEKNVQKWRDKLVAQRADVEKQMKEVNTKYPLVALAYAVQRALDADRLSEEIAANGSGILDRATMDRIAVEFRERKRKRERCLGNARTSADALQCLYDYPVL